MTHKTIEDAVVKRVRDRSVMRKDLEDLFSPAGDAKSLTADEWWLINILRARNIAPKAFEATVGQQNWLRHVIPFPPDLQECPGIDFSDAT